MKDRYLVMSKVPTGMDSVILSNSHESVGIWGIFDTAKEARDAITSHGFEHTAEMIVAKVVSTAIAKVDTYYKREISWD